MSSEAEARSRSWLPDLLELVEDRLGLDLTEQQQNSRLLPLIDRRVGELGLEGPAHYVRQLTLEPGIGEEWRRAVEALTNGQTFFFRDVEQFFGIETLLRGFLRQRASLSVNIWSAATSTGEEPYSLAILCEDLGIPAHLLATDLNHAFLDFARRGSYDPWALRNVSEERRERYFVERDGRYQVKDSLKAKIQFDRHNLVKDEPRRPPRGGRWDLILVRNVFLYFRAERIQHVCRRLAHLLHPDGALILGASESLIGFDVPLVMTPVGDRVIYQRSLGAAGAGPLPGLAKVRQASLASSVAPVSPPTLPRPPDPMEAVAAVTAMPEPQSAPARPVDEAIEHARAGRLEAAVEILAERADKKHSTLTERLVLGHLHLRRHELDEALQVYAGVLEDDPLLAEGHLFTGIAHRKAGRWHDAESALRRALFLAPHLWQAAELLAGTCARLGKSRDAERERARGQRSRAEQPRGFEFLTPDLFREWFELS